MSERIIFLVDLDAFFVAVEVALNPSLKGKPVIVGGMGPRGVVSTASYEARKFGIRSGMATALARRQCPNGIFLSGTRGVYGEYSRKFMEILETFAPVIQKVSIDEAYMDMTGTENLHGTPERAATNIRERIRKEIGITGSVGIGPNKLLAKIAADRAKPDGQLRVWERDAKEFMSPLSIRVMPGIGPKTALKLDSLGIETLGDLVDFDEGWLRRELGRNTAEWLRNRALGIDDSRVEEKREYKSLSAENTFDEDIADWEKLRSTLLELTEQVGRRLRALGKSARTVQIKARYPNFETITRQVTLDRPTDNDMEIFDAAEPLLSSAMNKPPGRIRLIGVGVSGFVERTSQLSLMAQEKVVSSYLYDAIDEVRAKFGKDSIKRGIVLQKKPSKGPPVRKMNTNKQTKPRRGFRS